MLKIERKLNVQLKNGLRFMVYVHDITSAHVEAIVNPTNEDLANTGGCAQIISTAAGPKFESDCKKIIMKKKRVKVTENEISGPGILPFKCIINTVGPQWASYDDNHKLSCLDDLYITIRKVLDTSEKEKIKSVATPPISSGIFGVPKELCAPVYVQAIVDFDFTRKQFPQEVHIVDLSDEVLDLTCKAYQSYTEDPRLIMAKAILKKYNEKVTKEIITKQTKSFDKYPEQNLCRLFKNDGEKAIFEMESGVKIFVYRDDLVMLSGIGTLVSAENSAFTGNGTLAKSILQHAGPSYVKHHNQVRRDLKDRRLAKNTLRTLDAGKLDYRYVIHAVVNRFAEDVDRKEDELLDLKLATFKVLAHGDYLCTSEKSKNLEKIAMPLLGAGDIRNPRILELLCSYVYQGMQDFFRYPSALKEVHLVSFNEGTHRAFMKVFLDVSANDFSASKNYPPLNVPSLRNTDNKSEVANSSSAIWKTKESTLVNWNDIHHKTKPTEESKCKCDYSDCDYLHCVEELEDKGITVSKTEKERTEKIMNTGML